MSVHMSIHNVVSISLASRARKNGNSRMILIEATDHKGQSVRHELRLFGNTDDLEALPKTPDFIDHDAHGRHEAAP